MSGRNSVLAVSLAGLVLAAGTARAQAPGATPTEPVPETGPEAETADDAGTATEIAPVAASARELGVRIGLAAGGRVTPGGLRFGAAFLYQLSAVDWFEGAADFTIGGTGAGCAVDPGEPGDSALVCDHGPLKGRAGEISAGIRRFLVAQQQFTPYVQGRLGLRVVRFSGDDITGVAALAIAGAGVRARVHDLVSISGGARLDLGAGLFGGDLGGEPQFGLSVHAGVEFLLE